MQSPHKSIAPLYMTALKSYNQIHAEKLARELGSSDHNDVARFIFNLMLSSAESSKEQLSTLDSRVDELKSLPVVKASDSNAHKAHVSKIRAALVNSALSDPHQESLKHGKVSANDFRRITQYGVEPSLKFRDGIAFRIAKAPFFCSRMSWRWHEYEPVMEDYQKYVKETGDTALGLLKISESGKVYFAKSLPTKEQNAAIDLIRNEIAQNVTKEVYTDYLVRQIRKLIFFYQTTQNQCFTETLNLANNAKVLTHKYSKLEILEIVNEAQKKEYRPKRKIVVFNPIHKLSSIQKSAIEKREFSRWIDRKIKESFSKDFLTAKELSEHIGLNLKTVRSHTKKLGLKLLSKSERTKARITQWYDENPKGSRKDCATALGITTRTINRVLE